MANERERSGDRDKSSSDQPKDRPVAPGTERPQPGHPGGPPVKPQEGDEPGVPVGPGKKP